MDVELVFRIIIGLFVAFGLGARAYFHRKAGTFQESLREQREGPVILVAGLLMVVWFVSMSLFLFAPGRIPWSYLRLPEWLRWSGVAISAVSAPFYLWIHRSLGKSFSGLLYVQEDHTLIQEGPYRWIRHPMYSAYLVGHLGYLLMTSNWLIGSAGLLTMLLIMLFRVPREEAALMEKFGASYREYVERTGRFLPKVLGPKPDPRARS